MEIREFRDGAEVPVGEILRRLPEWFGIPEARQMYVVHARAAPVIAAEVDSATIGFLSLAEHFGTHCEIHAMGVLPEWHRHGAGRRLVQAAVARGRRCGQRWLSVKTLSADHPDPHYAATRRFYEAQGFAPFEVLPRLWGPESPCLVMVRDLAEGP